MTSTVDLPAQRDDETTVNEPAESPDTVTVSEKSSDTSETGDRPDADPDADRQRQAAWENEYDRVLHLDPHEVEIDDNVRQENATTDPDTVRDMRNRGVNQAVRGYRADDGTVMITMGQRRVLNAREAGCQVPVWMQAPPPPDERKATIERIVAQVNENDLRVALTRGDEYKAVNQLRAFNLTPVGIARKLSRHPARIDNVLKVGDSELAAAAADRYDLDLEKMAVVAEFESYGDMDTAKELIQVAIESPNNFTVLAERKRRDRAEDQRVRELTEALTQELTDAGITILDNSVPQWSGDARTLDRLRPSPDSKPYTGLTLDAHTACPGHGAWIEQDYDDEENRIVVAQYGCADFRTHGHALDHAPEGQTDFSTAAALGTTDDVPGDDHGEGEQDSIAAAADAKDRARRAARIQRSWVVDNNKLWDAAIPTRRAWLAGFAKRKTAPQGSQVFLAVLKATGSHELRRAMERNHKLAHELLGLPQPRDGAPSQLPDKIATASPSKATLYDVFLTLCALEQDLTRDAWRKPWGFEQQYMSAITGWGYAASDVELNVLDPEREEDVISARLDNHEPDKTDDASAEADGEARDDGSDEDNSDDDTDDDDDSAELGPSDTPAGSSGDVDAELTGATV
ncbi:hypothetical protein [Amycolatopsis sp. lyj-112]|uniref:hypothetical protein n=1 Tax=Amycolatopsis sp. lyj-112 TaxID=2789288 RepID=UPI0039787644